MARKLWIVAGMALLMVSCTKTRTPDAQGQTHWWQSCDTNADCGDQTELSCICSVCMAECARSGASCEVEGRQAACFGPNADAVQALCGAKPAQAAVCLETCESECGDGFRCEDGACIAIEPQPQPTAGRGAAGSGAAGRGAAGTGEQDGGQGQPTATPLTIELVNGMLDVISAQTSDCGGNPSWFAIAEEGAAPNTIDPFGYCQADCATNPVGQQGCPAICRAPTFTTLRPSGSIRYEWDGLRWTADPARACSNHVPLASGTPLEIRFCWSKGVPREDIPGFPTPPPPEDVTCETVMTRLGEQTTVRFEVE